MYFLNRKLSTQSQDLESTSQSKPKSSKLKTQQRERWYQDDDDEFIEAQINKSEKREFQNTYLWEQFREFRWLNEREI
jgi:hypothetical protein